MNYKQPNLNALIQKQVGLIVFIFCFALSSIEFFYFFINEGMSFYSTIKQPSVFGVFSTAILFLITGLNHARIMQHMQVGIILISSYFSALTAVSGDLTSLIIFIIGYVLSIEYGFFTKFFRFKSLLAVIVYLLSMGYGLFINESSAPIVTIHSLIGAGLISFLLYTIICAQVRRDKMRVKDLEIEVNKRTAELQLALDEKETLLREVHHRTKNNMQLISSLINLEYTDIEDEAARMSADVSMRRIQSLAIAHEYLHQSENIQNINLKDYIDGFLSVIASDFNNNNVKINSITDSGIITNIEGAIPLGLIINELVTNAFKHAFFDQVAPEISIEAHQSNDRLVVLIEDNGSGLPETDAIDGGENLGLQIVVRLINQINGQYSIQRNNGTAWRISIPLEENGGKTIDRPVFFLDKGDE